LARLAIAAFALLIAAAFACNRSVRQVESRLSQTGCSRIVQAGLTRAMLDSFSCGSRLGAVMTLAARILVARAQAASRKAARERRSKLERELAEYATPAERRDLEAILDRYPYSVTHELRAILARQAMAAQDMRFPAIGRY